MASAPPLLIVNVIACEEPTFTIPKEIAEASSAASGCPLHRGLVGAAQLSVSNALVPLPCTVARFRRLDPLCVATPTLTVAEVAPVCAGWKMSVSET